MENTSYKYKLRHSRIDLGSIFLLDFLCENTSLVLFPQGSMTNSGCKREQHFIHLNYKKQKQKQKQKIPRKTKTKTEDPTQ